MFNNKGLKELIFIVNLFLSTFSVNSQIHIILKKNGTVNLSKKRLTELPEELFFFKKEVKILKLYGNKLKSITPRIAEFENLEELYIGKNFLDSLPKEIGMLKKLRILSVQYNDLACLPKEIGELVNLEQLWLNQNKLQSLPVEIGNLKKLERLQLNYNFLKEIPKEISECEKLRFLYLNRNFITKLPEDIGRLGNLKELYLSNAGPLLLVPESVCDLRYLELLEIDLQIQIPPCLIVHQTNRLRIQITQ